MSEHNDSQYKEDPKLREHCFWTFQDITFQEIKNPLVIMRYVDVYFWLSTMWNPYIKNSTPFIQI